jgi:F-type H+-transporting ATPase subunit epsilon
MATTVQCNIVSADESLFSGAVEMVVATGSLGELGINAGHAPLLSDLKPGPVRVIKAAGEEEIFFLSGGYLEVQPNAISILADTAVRANDIDEAAAAQALKDAEHAIANQTGEIEYSKAACNVGRGNCTVTYRKSLAQKTRADKSY